MDNPKKIKSTKNQVNYVSTTPTTYSLSFNLPDKKSKSVYNTFTIDGLSWSYDKSEDSIIAELNEEFFIENKKFTLDSRLATIELFEDPNDQDIEKRIDHSVEQFRSGKFSPVRKRK